MSDCLFCKIVNKDIPAEIVYEDEQVLGFKDINPSAKIHLLFIHKKHNVNVAEMVRENPNYVADVFTAIVNYAQEHGLENSGYRIVTNLGSDGCQAVFHTHFHLLAGEKLTAKFGAE